MSARRPSLNQIFDSSGEKRFEFLVFVVFGVLSFETRGGREIVAKRFECRTYVSVIVLGVCVEVEALRVRFDDFFCEPTRQARFTDARFTLYRDRLTATGLCALPSGG